MSFWVLALIQLGTLILGQLLKPKVKRQRGPDLEGWFAEEGRPDPIVYGTQALSGNVAWWGDGVQSGDEIGTYYYANMILRVCLGVVDAIVDVQWGQKSIRLEPRTKAQSSGGADPVVDPPFPASGFLRSGATPATFGVHARQMFGGKDREGGVEGEIRFYWGTTDQAVDALTTHSVANETITLGTARPGIAYACLGTVADPFYWGRNPTPKELTFVVCRQPRALLDLGLDAAYTDHTVGTDANPAEIIYDLLFSRNTGAGINTQLVDLVQLAAWAATCQREQFGLSLTIASQDEIKDLLDELCRHVDGVMAPDLETGLLGATLVRADYEVGDLTAITVANASDFQKSDPNWRALVNEVRTTYRRWTGGTFGDVTNEVLSSDFEVIAGIPARYQSKGRNLANVTVILGGVTLVEGTDYTFDIPTGIVFVSATATTLAHLGDDLTISYSAQPTAMRLVEAVAQEADLADQQLTGETRPVALDFPWVTRELLAQLVTKRQIRALGLPLEKGTFRINRTGHGLTVGQPVRITYAPWSWADFVVRITNIPDAGTLEDGKITVEWVEDVWGEDARPSLPTQGGGTETNQLLVGPRMAALYCSGTADQITLQASDTSFAIQLQRADDTSGTSAADVAGSPFVGTTTSYTDATTGKTHRARHVRTGWTPGPWTDWLAVCTLTDAAVCTLPAITDAASVVDTTGTLTVGIVDDQQRVALVEFRVTAADGVVGLWTTDTTPYEATVDLVAGATAFIARRVTYFDCTGTQQIGTAEYPFTVDLGVPVPDPGTTGITSLSIPIPFITGLVGLSVLDIPSEATPLTVSRGTETKLALDQATGVRVQACIESSTAPVGTALAFEFELSDAPGGWVPMDGTDAGPLLAIDSASLDLLDPNPDTTRWNVTGTNVTLLDEAHGDLRIRAVILGGTGDLVSGLLLENGVDRLLLEDGSGLLLIADIRSTLLLESGPHLLLEDGTSLLLAEDSPDATGEVNISHLELQPTFGPQEPVPSNDPPPLFDPGSCDTPNPITITSGTSEENDAPTHAVFSVVGSTIHLALDGSGTGHARKVLALTGLTALNLYTFYLTVTQSQAASGAFLEVVGGTSDVATTTSAEVLSAQGTTDGSGNLTVRFGVSDVAAATTNSFADALSYASQAAAAAAGWTVGNSSSDIAVAWNQSHTIGGGFTAGVQLTLNGAGGGGAFTMVKSFTGTPGALYHAELYKDSLALHFESLKVEITNGTTIWSASGGGASGQQHLVTNSVTAPASGIVTVTITKDAGFPYSHVNEQYWFAGLAVVTPGGTAATVDFEMAGSCLGNGLGDGQTGLGGGGGAVGDPATPPDDPIPDPPPGGFPPPVIGTAQVFGAFALPPAGLGFWNATMFQANARNIVDAVRIAQAADTTLFVQFRADDAWMAGGKFQVPLWKAALDVVYNDARAKAAMDSGIASGNVRIFIIDEPYHPTRYGGPIPLVDAEHLCQYAKFRWPTAVTTIGSLNPYRKAFWLTRHINGLDHTWGEYSLAGGDPVAYRNNALDAADGIGHPMYLGVHYLTFTPGVTHSYPTPAQLEYYGKIMADTDRSMGFMGWKYWSTAYAQPGWVGALQRVRNLLASHHP